MVPSVCCLVVVLVGHVPLLWLPPEPHRYPHRARRTNAVRPLGVDERGLLHCHIHHA